MAETFIHISSSLQDKVPADPWAGNCCERFVGRGRVCFKAEEPWQSNANNCPIWLASAASLKLFGSICGCWFFFLILFFSGSIINTAAHGLIAWEGAVSCMHFFPWFPLMRVFPVQAQQVDPVSSPLIPSPLLPSLQLFLTNIGQQHHYQAQPLSFAPTSNLCMLPGQLRPIESARGPKECMILVQAPGVKEVVSRRQPTPAITAWQA